jgi:hypothetical protein
VVPLDGNSPVTHINGKQCKAVTAAYNMSIKKMAVYQIIRFAATPQHTKSDDFHPSTLSDISTSILTICCM